MFDMMAQPEGKVGAKKLRKLEAKAEKKAQREVIREINTCLHFTCYWKVLGRHIYVCYLVVFVDICQMSCLVDDHSLEFSGQIA